METVATVISGIAVVIFAVIWFRRAKDTAPFMIRMGFTIPWLVLAFFCTHKGLAGGSGSPMTWAFSVFYLIGFLAVLGIIWVAPILGILGGLFGSLFDGGTAAADPKPFYSIFRTKKLKGDYFGALAEVRRQLEKFPGDFEGMMLLAELQAENLNDLPGAEVTVQRAYSTPDRPPVNIAVALNRLISVWLALLRSASTMTMGTFRTSVVAALVSPHDRIRVKVKKGVENIGLMRDQGVLKPREENQEDVAAEYVKHLEEHPLDGHAREKLAIIYADHYHRLDLALDQLEQLVQQPGHPAKQVAHWLNVMVDLQVREGVGYEEVRGTLQRIIDQYAGTALAASAQRRQDALKLEIKAQEQRQSTRMGTYEQNIGLKKRTA